jgi:biopolymer transport protein ExbD
MPKMKVPRKSTTIDMTAMCDVAFLLLSFFIFTAKFKKSEEIPITIPFSVHSDSVLSKNKLGIYVEVPRSGKVLMSFDNDTIAGKVINYLSKYKGLNLTEENVLAFRKRTAFGMDLADAKRYLETVETPNAQKEQDGIPVMDSANSQLQSWIEAYQSVYMDSLQKNNDLDREVFIKADKAAPFEVVEKVMDIFAGNGLDRFKLVTAPKDVPLGTMLDKKKKEPAKI